MSVILARRFVLAHGSYNLAPCYIVVCCLYLINTVGVKSNSSRLILERMCPVYQVLRHEEFEEGCKASCNGYVCHVIL